LWDLPPQCSKSGPSGKLKLCLGMPVMIRWNTATELSITRGRRAFVRGWQQSVGRYNQPVLDVLFVELYESRETVHIDSLPDNIVPIPK
jgi:hypothetical protein